MISYFSIHPSRAWITVVQERLIVFILTYLEKVEFVGSRG